MAEIIKPIQPGTYVSKKFNKNAEGLLADAGLWRVLGGQPVFGLAFYEWRVDRYTSFPAFGSPSC